MKSPREQLLDYLDRYRNPRQPRLSTNEIIEIADKAQEFYTRCKHCNGTGKRFVALYGADVCSACYGTGRQA